MTSDYLICPERFDSAHHLRPACGELVEPVERANRERLEAMPVHQFMSAFIK